MDRLAADKLERAAEAHFRLYFYAAVVGLVRQAVDAFGSPEAAVERFPFLTGYINELAQWGLEGAHIGEAPARWRDRAEAWEREVPERLPLRALRDAAALEYEDLVAFVGAGLVEEDMRFGALFSALHGTAGDPRPTASMVAAWGEGGAPARPWPARIRYLAEIGVLQAAAPDAPLSAWSLRVPPLLWAALRGHAAERLAPGLRLRRPGQAPELESLVLDDALRAAIAPLGRLLAAGEADTVLVRGPRSNGRRSLLAALARSEGRGVLEIHPAQAGAEPLRCAGPLAALLDAVPVFVLETVPGEAAQVPALSCPGSWRGVVTDLGGGCRGLEGGRNVALTLAAPGPAARAALWSRAGPELSPDAAQELGTRFRMTSGAVAGLARSARAQARLAGRGAPGAADLAAARESLERGELETLALRLPAAGDWGAIVAAPETRAELMLLESRCRHRERLAQCARGAPAPGGPGVRALFKGPSGTGKTLAARLLASALEMDLYRVDLSAVVNKYIGETEKHLARLFDRAGELDAILLFDEGDALFGKRTGVQSSNDRYANLQTNFLLQRIEGHEGIVLVTTNLGDAIDGAFQRRMDVVVEFGLPDAAERLAIWRLHLPADHRVPEALLEDLAWRCSLNGGQIRNAVSHAALLALAAAAPLGGGEVTAAVEREYRKAGGVSPLRAGTGVREG